MKWGHQEPRWWRKASKTQHGLDFNLQQVKLYIQTILVKSSQKQNIILHIELYLDLSCKGMKNTWMSNG